MYSGSSGAASGKQRKSRPGAASKRHRRRLLAAAPGSHIGVSAAATATTRLAPGWHRVYAKRMQTRRKAEVTKSSTVHIRLPQPDAATIRQAAARFGIPISTFMRLVALGAARAALSDNDNGHGGNIFVNSVATAADTDSDNE